MSLNEYFEIEDETLRMILADHNERLFELLNLILELAEKDNRIIAMIRKVTG